MNFSILFLFNTVILFYFLLLLIHSDLLLTHEEKQAVIPLVAQAWDLLMLVLCEGRPQDFL